MIEKTLKVHHNTVRTYAHNLEEPILNMAYSPVIYGDCLESLINVLCGFTQLQLPELHYDRLSEKISFRLIEFAGTSSEQKLMLTSSTKAVRKSEPIFQF